MCPCARRAGQVKPRTGTDSVRASPLPARSPDCWPGMGLPARRRSRDDLAPQYPCERRRRTVLAQRRTEVTDRMLIFGDRHLRPVTAGDDPIAAAGSGHHGPAAPSPTLPRSGSSAGPSSAASPTITSGLRRSPGQRRWPSFGTLHAHQMLSVVIGLAAGLAGGALACGVQALTRSSAQPAP
jgi:hypothetical protein